jgi:hypothetical protein
MIFSLNSKLLNNTEISDKIVKEISVLFLYRPIKYIVSTKQINEIKTRYLKTSPYHILIEIYLDGKPYYIFIDDFGNMRLVSEYEKYTVGFLEKFTIYDKIEKIYFEDILDILSKYLTN